MVKITANKWNCMWTVNVNVNNFLSVTPLWYVLMENSNHILFSIDHIWKVGILNAKMLGF